MDLTSELDLLTDFLTLFRAESSEVVTLRHVERARPKHRDEEEEAVITAPKFHSPMKDLLQLKEGQSAHFETKLTPVNDPNLKVIWMFNGRPIDASRFCIRELVRESFAHWLHLRFSILLDE